jgi:hypothetical protein
VNAKFAAARGYIGAALLLLGGVAFTLMLLAALQSGADIRNSRANAGQPWTWNSLAAPTQLSQSDETRRY